MLSETSGAHLVRIIGFSLITLHIRVPRLTCTICRFKRFNIEAAASAEDGGDDVADAAAAAADVAREGVASGRCPAP